MSVILPLPDKMEFTEWAARFSSAFPDQFVSAPQPGESWLIWADRLFLQERFASFPIPTLLAYPKPDDWRLWACQVILLLG